MKTVEIKVAEKAIHCSGCETRIETVLGKLPGVIKVNADHNEQKVELVLDEAKTPVERVKQALETAGYRTE